MSARKGAPAADELASVAIRAFCPGGILRGADTRGEGVVKYVLYVFRGLGFSIEGFRV